jgi:enamine deaminase RidA (YjgF/YER057c/UK114 family)
LEAAGATLADTVMVTLYVTNVGFFGHLNRIYRDCFGDAATPARTCISRRLLALRGRHRSRGHRRRTVPHPNGNFRSNTTMKLRILVAALLSGCPCWPAPLQCPAHHPHRRAACP